MTGIRALIHRKITSQPILRPVNILKDLEFLPASKKFEVVCKSFTDVETLSPKRKSPIQPEDMEKLKLHFSINSPEKFQESFASNCVIIWADEGEKVGGNLGRIHLNSSKTTKTKHIFDKAH